METITEQSYNCVDCLATSRIYEEMLREDRERNAFKFDQAILGPAITMQLRGIRVDRAKIKQADEETTDLARDLQKTIEEVSPLKIKWGRGIKPSPIQMQKILYGEMGVRVRTSREGAPTANKEAIAAILEDHRTPEAALPLLEAYQELSVLEEDQKILRKPLREDGRLHTTWVPAGTTTGRFCLPPEVEVLTKSGWITLQDWDEEDKILCWSPDNDSLKFSLSKKLQFDNDESLIQISSGDRGKFKLLCTSDHKLPSRTTKGNLSICKAGERKTLHETILASHYNANFVPEFQTRISVMVQADGHMVNRNSMLFGFSKQRKIIRCLELLNSANIKFETRVNKKGVTTVIVKDAPNWMLQSKCFGSWLLNHDPNIFIDEIPAWDGGKQKSNRPGINYYTTDIEAANWVQTMAHLCGKSCIIRDKYRMDQRWHQAYSVYITQSPYTRTLTKDYTDSGFIPSSVFCAETQTGFFMIRCQGTISITGNSAKQDHFDFGFNLQAFSHRLHKICVPDDGYVLVSIDQMQAESKGVAYLAGCQRYKDMHAAGNVHVQVGQWLYPDTEWTSRVAKDTKLPWDKNKSYYDLFKKVQHAGNYGESPYGMARQLHMKVKEAEILQTNYFNNLPEIIEWQHDVAQQLKVYHSLTTPLGRSRLFLGRTWDNSLVKEAIAYVPQSMISQLNKIILWRIWNHFDPDRAQILMEGHDSNIFQVREGDAETVEEILQMSRIEVPIRGDIMPVGMEAEWGYNWGKESLQEWKGHF